MVNTLFDDEVKCNHFGCFDQSQFHLMQVEYNQRYGMPDHYNLQSGETQDGYYEKLNNAINILRQHGIKK